MSKPPQQLTGPQYKQIYDALEEAFDYESLERLLGTALDPPQALHIVASKYRGFGEVVWTTLRWAESEGRAAELVAAAKAAKPGNDHLQALPTDFAAAAGEDPRLDYHKGIVGDLSSARYQLDRRFVRLTLLLDQGPEFQGVRHIQDPRHKPYDNLRTLLAEIEERAVVLLGKPGSGKTTLLRRLQLEQTWAELDDDSGRTTFYVSLNSYKAKKPRKPPPDPLDWLAELWRLYNPRLPSFDTYFRAGRLLLLLDGLNEMPHRDRKDYRSRIGKWQLFLQQTYHCGNTVLFGCRSLDYSASLNSEQAPVRQVNVEPLSPGQIEEYLTLHLGDRGADVWKTLSRDDEQVKLFSAPFFLRLLADQVEVAGEIPTGQAALLTGFVRNALKREIDRSQRLFEPDGLLEEDDVQQVLYNRWPTPTALPLQGALIPQLSSLAYRMQDGRRSGEKGQVRVPGATAQKMLSFARPDDLISAGIQLNVLDKELATRDVFFYHQLIQEYFAARTLAAAPEPARASTPWRASEAPESLAETVAGLGVSDPLPGPETTGWEETIILAAAMADDQEQFVAELMPANLPLAARCAVAPEVRVSPELTAQLQQALLARIGAEEADLRARIAAAEALGDLGDPRFERRRGPHGDYLQPPLVLIPGDVYTIGNDNSPYAIERPAHPVEVAPFELGAFPVTNAEYRLFMNADGYEEERWWETEAAREWLKGAGGNEGLVSQYQAVANVYRDLSEEAIRNLSDVTQEQIDLFIWLRNTTAEELADQLKEWFPSGELYRQPEFWDDSRFNHPAQPVVGITWHEARAYCAWLSAQTGDNYGLPTEVEWEAAARGKAGRIYAYDNTYDSARCNTFETHIRRTTPVGVFPGGWTPEGIADLTGNVSEWTTTIWGESVRETDFPYPYQADEREDLTNGTALRVLRGGSWLDSAGWARAAFRDGFNPVARPFDHGFRVAARRPPSRPDH